MFPLFPADFVKHIVVPDLLNLLCISDIDWQADISFQTAGLIVKIGDIIHIDKKPAQKL